MLLGPDLPRMFSRKVGMERKCEYEGERNSSPLPFSYINELLAQSHREEKDNFVILIPMLLKCIQFFASLFLTFQKRNELR